MKKILNVIVVLSVLFLPLSLGAISDNQSIVSLKEQINALKEEITKLLAQLELIKEQKEEVKETTKELKASLQLEKHLRVGMRGEDVKLLQEFLSTDPEIYPEGLITGYFGSLTEAAVKRFQKKMGVEQVGLVGPKTFFKINQLLQEGAGTSEKVPPGLLIASGLQKKIPFIDFSESLDKTAPIISELTVLEITATSALIEWKTDEPAKSKVRHATSTPLKADSSSLSMGPSEYLLEHSILLSDLLPDTTYYYSVISIDKSGNAATSEEKSFITQKE